VQVVVRFISESEKPRTTSVLARPARAHKLEPEVLKTNPGMLDCSLCYTRASRFRGE
jgi:hypothetical protein